MDPAETHRSRGREHVPIHHRRIRREAVPSRLSRCFTGPERVISKSYSLIGVPLMPTPNLPSGFDFTDPDVHAERLPVEELAELRRTAPIWWNEQPDWESADSTTAASGWCPNTRTSRRFRAAATSSPAWRTPRCRATKTARCASSVDTRQVRAAQHGRPAAHPSAQDHLPRLHTPGRRAPPRRPPRAGPADRRRTRRRKVPATSSNRCRASFRCRPSPA